MDHERTPYKPETTFNEMTGLVLGREHRSYRATGTPEHVWQVYVKVQKHNLLLGWWSIYALIINPILLVTNTVSWFGFKRDYNEFLYSPETFQKKQKRKADRKYKSEHRSPWTVIKWTLISIVGFFALMMAIIFIASAA